MRALELHQQGWTQRDIAAALGATEGAVSQWLAAARHGGPEALASHTDRRGVAPKLTPEQVRLIPDFLWHGAEAYGFRGDVWTCDRVAGVIREEFGVSYSKSQVSRLLKRPGMDPAGPDHPGDPAGRGGDRALAGRVVARVEGEGPPRAPGACFRGRIGVLPAARAWSRPTAPRARTPVVDEWQTRDHLSVMGGVTPQGKVYSLVRPKSLNGLHTIEFLIHLGRLAGDRLLVIWDGSPIHRRAEVSEFVAEAPGKIHVEPLPAYAPDLNPVEWLWRHLKEVELRNLSCLDLEQLHLEFHLALRASALL